MNTAPRAPRKTSNSPSSGVYTRDGFETPANRPDEETTLEALIRRSQRPGPIETSLEPISVPPLSPFDAKPIPSLLPPPKRAAREATRSRVMVALPWTLLVVLGLGVAIAWPRAGTIPAATVRAAASPVAAAAIVAPPASEVLEAPPIAFEDMPLDAVEAQAIEAELEAETAPEAEAEAAAVAPEAAAIEFPLVDPALALVESEPAPAETPVVETAVVAEVAPTPAPAAPAPNVVHTFDQIQARIQAGPAAQPTVAAPTVSERPSRSDVATALRRVQSAVDACTTDVGHVTIRLTVANDGSVSAAHATGDYAGTPAGACMADAVREARFPAFTATPMTISYPFTLR
jgi:hypothetical protein